MSVLTLTSERTYKTTHPWISFDISLECAPPDFWMALGECNSKCEHLAGIPLAPEINQYLHQVYLAKGAAATTAIEGNTLSEAQVLQHIQGKLAVPPSQEYLTQEIDNIVEGCNLILGEIWRGVEPPLNLQRIKELNSIVLKKLTFDDPDVIPGEIREDVRGAGTYRGAPPQDCEYLTDRLCEWLNSDVFRARPGMEIPFAVLRAIVAHLYLAWIHPFGDGNGRTARLVEVQILLSSGIPSPAAHLLSNHYNMTRTEYYRQLELARKDVISFLHYAATGFRDGLRNQIAALRQEQWEIAWINHVHRMLDQLKGGPHDRRKHLILDLSKSAEAVAFPKLRDLSPRVAIDYKDRSNRTLIRDVQELIRMNLLDFDRETSKFRAKKETILAFLPTKALAK
jgi:Fic family protein